MHHNQQKTNEEMVMKTYEVVPRETLFRLDDPISLNFSVSQSKKRNFRRL